MWTLIVGSGRRLCARLVMPLLAHELPLHATEVAVHRILPRQLVVVAKVVDALVLVEVHCIHVVADPTDVDPCDIPVSVGLGLAPAAGSKDVVDGITKGGAEPNCALHAPASVVRAGARGRSAVCRHELRFLFQSSIGRACGFRGGVGLGRGHTERGGVRGVTDRATRRARSSAGSGIGSQYPLPCLPGPSIDLGRRLHSSPSHSQLTTVFFVCDLTLRHGF